MINTHVGHYDYQDCKPFSFFFFNKEKDFIIIILGMRCIKKFRVRIRQNSPDLTGFYSNQKTPESDPEH